MVAGESVKLIGTGKTKELQAGFSQVLTGGKERIEKVV